MEGEVTTDRFVLVKWRYRIHYLKCPGYFLMSLRSDWTLQCIIQGHLCSGLFTFVSAQLGESRRRACEKLLPAFSASNNAQLKYEAEQSPCLPGCLPPAASGVSAWLGWAQKPLTDTLSIPVWTRTVD